MQVVDVCVGDVARDLLSWIAPYHGFFADLADDNTWATPYKDWTFMSLLELEIISQQLHRYVRDKLPGRRVYIAERGYIIVTRQTPVNDELTGPFHEDDLVIQLPGAQPQLGYVPNTYILELGGKYAIPTVSD